MTAALTVIQPPPAPAAAAAAIRSGGREVALARRLELAAHPLNDQPPVGHTQRHLPTLERACLGSDADPPNLLVRLQQSLDHWAQLQSKVRHRLILVSSRR
jgi:hypothetical protein